MITGDLANQSLVNKPIGLLNSSTTRPAWIIVSKQRPVARRTTSVTSIPILPSKNRFPQHPMMPNYNLLVVSILYPQPSTWIRPITTVVRAAALMRFTLNTYGNTQYVRYQAPMISIVLKLPHCRGFRGQKPCRIVERAALQRQY